MKLTIEIEAADIPTMESMSEYGYKQYIENELLFVDHHDVLRSGVAQYPLAVTRAQLRILIKHLQDLQTKVGSERG